LRAGRITFSGMPRSRFSFLNFTRALTFTLAISLTVTIGTLVQSVSARAGGGEGYSGGSDGGGYTGGDGGFSFTAPEGGPLHDGTGAYGGSGGSTFGMLVALVIIVGLLWFLSRKKLKGGGLPNPSQHARARIRRDIPALTPSLEAARLLKALPRMFVDIQQAWSNRDLESVHRDLSDGVFSRWQIQLDLMRREGRRNLALEPQLLSAHVVDERQEGEYETIDVILRASLIDLELREGDPLPSSGDRKQLPQPSSFDEVWSFTRKQGGKPSENAPAYGEQCANCGAPLAGTQGVKCGHCGALLNSGAYDWVLAEITQIETWSPRRNQPTKRGLSTQELEDRASTVFVRLVQAHLDKRPGLMRPYASEAWVETLTRGESPLQGVGLQRLAIGKVELGDLQTHEGRMLAKISVMYSSGRKTMMANTRPGTLVMLFAKSLSDEAQAKTAGFNSLNCPKCGAPVAGSEQARCAYCNETLNDPEHHWVLEGIQPR
jgi:Tim44-like domain